MGLGRLRHGELLCGAASAALLVLLALDWFEGEGLTATGYGGLGIVLVVLLVVLALLGLALVVVTAKGRPVAWIMTADIWTSMLGILLVPALLLRALVLQPALDAGLGNTQVALEPAGWAGLLVAVLIPVGSWLAMGDERKDAPESAYTPPPARPIPGAGS
ncbi:hypothetical protein [Conexibacter sp. SYSU D00693]|uniref:hypothetical protein n=1 Tax=Conexibacter sp. SYSU D00693 TaxID=2812560 RepID=UPI00196ADD66|nr:hypothetical protein [Conexibacter sp. SYSU D00693]